MRTQNYGPGLVVAILFSAAAAFATSMSTLTFTSFGTLTCGAGNAGIVKPTTNGQVLQFCDNAATPALRHLAAGDSNGDALGGDSATGFFLSGQIEAARGGTGIDTSGSTGVPRIASGTWSADAGFLNLGDTPASYSGEGGNCAKVNVGETALEFGACGAGGGGYDTIEDETTPLTQRTSLNFAGAGVSCADDTTKTTCTISGSASPLTTKGDLFTFDTGDARLAIGANGLVLTADSAEATGMKWAAAGGSGDTATFVRKATTESVTSSTTLQDDDELLFAIGANETWEFEFIVLAFGAEAGDIKVAVEGPTGTGGYFSVIGPAVAATSSIEGVETRQVSGIAPTASAQSFGTTAASRVLRIKGIAVNGATAGNVKLLWAQNASNGTATQVSLNSYLTAWNRTP